MTAVPLMLFAGAAQSVPFTLLGPLNLIVPVINVILGWVVYDERCRPSGSSASRSSGSRWWR